MAIEKEKNWRSDPVTVRQRAGLRLIRRELRINVPDAETKGEAHDTLDKYLPAAKARLRRDRDYDTDFWFHEGQMGPHF
jgi:hypothetical protein